MDRFSLGLISPWGLTVFGTVGWLCVGVALSYIFPWLVWLVRKSIVEDIK
jgi:hypothetical protein